MRPLIRRTTETRRAGHEVRIEALERRFDRKGFYEIKLAPDDGPPPLIGNGAFIFSIPDDLHKTYLRFAETFVTTAGSSATIVMVRNVIQAVDMLTTAITIDSGDLESRDAAVRSVIDDDPDNENNMVFSQDQVAIDIDAAGSGAFGLGIMLRFI